jgi:hypothetical protein
MKGCGTFILVAYLAALGYCVAVDGPIAILYAVIGFCAGYLAASILKALLGQKS